MVMTGSDLCASTKPWALQVAGYWYWVFPGSWVFPYKKNTNTKPRALQVALLKMVKDIAR